MNYYENRKEVCLCECIFDITLQAQHMIEEHQIKVENSRELFYDIFKWSKDFEKDYDDENSQTYIEDIDEYGYAKLLETYGVKGDNNENHEI